MKVPTDDVIGADIYINRRYHEYEFSLRAVRFLRKRGFLPPNTDTVLLDIGANVGPISLGLVMAGEVERALAIEPEPQNFTLLSTNVQQNGLSDRILCLQTAVGAEPSTLCMELSALNRGDHRIRFEKPLGRENVHDESARPVISVPSLPLPQIFELPQVAGRQLQAPTLIWIDVQGYEGYVFSGARQLLTEGRQPTVAEIWPYGILRVGMTMQDFHGVVADIWSDFWVERRCRFSRYPIAVFDCYLEELGTDGHAENVIFTKA